MLLALSGCSFHVYQQTYFTYEVREREVCVGYPWVVDVLCAGASGSPRRCPAASPPCCGSAYLARNPSGVCVYVCVHCSVFILNVPPARVTPVYVVSTTGTLSHTSSVCCPVWLVIMRMGVDMNVLLFVVYVMHVGCALL